MDFISVITIVSLLWVFVVATALVFLPIFKDTLVQRIALAGIAIGALSAVVRILSQGYASFPMSTISIFTVIFTIESLRKMLKDFELSEYAEMDEFDVFFIRKRLKKLRCSNTKDTHAET